MPKAESDQLETPPTGSPNLGLQRGSAPIPPAAIIRRLVVSLKAALRRAQTARGLDTDHQPKNTFLGKGEWELWEFPLPVGSLFRLPLVDSAAGRIYRLLLICLLDKDRPSHRSAQSPFTPCGCDPHGGDATSISSENITPPSSLLRTHSPVAAASPLLRFSLVGGVCAGCHQSLLPAGPSRRYLRESFLGCWTPYPGGPTACAYLFLPLCHRPSPQGAGSASRE